MTKSIQRSDIEIAAVVMVSVSLISCAYLDWYGLLVGPSLLAFFAWAYYSTVAFVWVVEFVTRSKL